MSLVLALELEKGKCHYCKKEHEGTMNVTDLKAKKAKEKDS